MRTVVCERPFAFALKETPEPVVGSGEVLVQVRRIGICGTDLHAFRGNQPYFTYPRVLGHELSGVVEEVGGLRGPTEGGSNIQVGDKVAIIPYLECGTCIACVSGKPNCCTSLRVLGVHTDGGMCERIVVPIDHVIQTNDLTFDQAVLLEPLSIGAHAVRRSGLGPEDTALVIGAGPIGLGVMAFAKQRGAKVVAMDINEERLNFCKVWAGADETFRVEEEATEMRAERLAHIAGGDLPTVVYDATGNARSMMEAMYYVAHGGTLVYVGLTKEEITFSNPEFHKREITLLSSRNATRQDFEVVMGAVRGGRIDTQKYITHRSDLISMPGEFPHWTRPESRVIKAVVHVE